MVLPRSFCAALGAAVFLIAGAGVASASGATHPEVIHANRHDVSAPMRDIIRTMPPEAPLGTESEPYQIPNILIKPEGNVARSPYLPGIQRAPTGVSAPPVDLSFEAISSATSGCGCLPPDTNGDIGDNEYVQWVNTRWAVYDKTTGAQIQAPTAGNSFWVGFGGKCETTNSGDPIALFDQRAHRWVMSQFVTSAPYAQCVAVSTSDDPLGTYNRYEFDWPAGHFGDYPKLAVWSDESGSQDAYLLTTHEFADSGGFFGAALIALERDKMIAGDADAAMVRFGGFDAYGVEPVNLIGSLDAPAGTCGDFTHFDGASSEYLFWDICLDWTTPANTTISSDPTRVAGAPFVPYYDEVPQTGTANGLDSFGTHIMYRANARAFPADAPTRISLVVNHVVQGDVQQGGINWVHFNLRPTSTSGGDRIFGDGFDGTPLPPLATPEPSTKTLVDQGVYAPDSDTRWMGGVAMDSSGNIGVGFSKSSATSNPQIEITGRTLNDPAGTLRDEQNCTDGIANGSQTSSSNRWGDYSSMSVDPTDQCTFYFTDEYYPTTAAASWHTRVCSFKFPDCGQPDFALVADTPARLEVCGATATSDPAYDIRAGVLNGFTGDVTLAASGVPGGATAQFSVNPIAAPGSSIMTLVGGAALPSGEYDVDVTGTSGALTRSVALELGVSSAAPAAPTLQTPADTATGVKVRPTLVWSAVPGALSYFVEVATDAGFSNVVASSTVEDATWTVDVTLDSTTQYFWRVTPHNYCGDGAMSATSSFTTGVPGECPTGTTASTLYEDTFESGVNGWTAGGTGATGWTQGPAATGTGLSTTVWSVPDNTTSSDRTLTSPVIAIPGSAQSVILSYDAYHNSETDPPSGCWDSSSIETSTDGTTFDYLDASHMFTDPYNGTASPGAPLAGRLGWCYASSPAPSHSIVDLDAFAGQNLQVRFRMVSDSNTAASAPNGLAIDDFKVEICQ